MYNDYSNLASCEPILSSNIMWITKLNSQAFTTLVVKAETSSCCMQFFTGVARSVLKLIGASQHLVILQELPNSVFVCFGIHRLLQGISHEIADCMYVLVLTICMFFGLLRKTLSFFPMVSHKNSSHFILVRLTSSS